MYKLLFIEAGEYLYRGYIGSMGGSNTIVLFSYKEIIDSTGIIFTDILCDNVELLEKIFEEANQFILFNHKGIRLDKKSRNLFEIIEIKDENI